MSARGEPRPGARLVFRFKARPSSAHLWTDGGKGRDRETRGVVRTEHGLVQCASWFTKANTDYLRGTHLHFVWKGRVYMLRVVATEYTKRGLVTLAVRFARDVAAGKVWP